MSTAAGVDRREHRTARPRRRDTTPRRPKTTWRAESSGHGGVFRLGRRTGLAEPTARLTEAPARLAEASAWLTEAASGLSKPDSGLPESTSRLAEASARLAEATSRLAERLPAGAWRAAHPGPRKPRPAGARLRGRGQVHERPLVVAVHPVIELDGLLLALRGDALDAHRGLRGLAERSRGRRPSRRPRLRRPEPTGPALSPRGVDRSSTRPGQARPPTGHRAADGNDLEVVVGDGVLVFLPKELLLDEDVHRGRERVRVAALEQHDGAPVLLAAPDELFFLLALGEVRPHGQRGRHHHGHHAHADEQRGHGVAALSRATALTR